MAESKRRRTRKLRRSLKAVMAFGVNAKARHRSPSGRTGKVKQVRMKSLHRHRGGLVAPPERSRGPQVERCGDYSQHPAHDWVGPGLHPKTCHCPGARAPKGDAR